MHGHFHNHALAVVPPAYYLTAGSTLIPAPFANRTAPIPHPLIVLCVLMSPLFLPENGGRG